MTDLKTLLDGATEAGKPVDISEDLARGRRAARSRRLALTLASVAAVTMVGGATTLGLSILRPEHVPSLPVGAGTATQSVQTPLEPATTSATDPATTEPTIRPVEPETPRPLENPGPAGVTFRTPAGWQVMACNSSHCVLSRAGDDNAVDPNDSRGKIFVMGRTPQPQNEIRGKEVVRNGHTYRVQKMVPEGFEFAQQAPAGSPVPWVVVQAPDGFSLDDATTLLDSVRFTADYVEFD